MVYAIDSILRLHRLRSEMNESVRKRDSLCCIDRQVIEQNTPSSCIELSVDTASCGLDGQQPPDAQNIAPISHEPLGAKQAPIFDGVILDVGIEQESLVILKLMVEVRMQDAAEPKEREKPTFKFLQVSYNPFHSR